MRIYPGGMYVFSEVFDLKPTSGLSHAQSWLKNPAHLSHFFTERTVSADRHLCNRPRPRPRPRSRSLNVVGNSARFPRAKESRTRTTTRTRTIGEVPIRAPKHIRPSGTGPLFACLQALRARLLSFGPSGTGLISILICDLK